MHGVMLRMQRQFMSDVDSLRLINMLSNVRNDFVACKLLTITNLLRCKCFQTINISHENWSKMEIVLRKMQPDKLHRN